MRARCDGAALGLQKRNMKVTGKPFRTFFSKNGDQQFEVQRSSLFQEKRS